MKTNIHNLNLTICKLEFISHIRRNGIQINVGGYLMVQHLKNDSKCQVQELPGYMTVQCAQQIQQFSCGSCMIHFMFETNKLALEQASVLSGALVKL
jgi:hypothetical protein